MQIELGPVPGGRGDQLGQLAHGRAEARAQVQRAIHAVLDGGERATDDVVDVDPVADLLAVAPDGERVLAGQRAVSERTEREVRGLVFAVAGERPYDRHRAAGLPVGVGEAFAGELHPAVDRIRLADVIAVAPDAEY